VSIGQGVYRIDIRQHLVHFSRVSRISGVVLSVIAMYFDPHSDAVAANFKFFGDGQSEGVDGCFRVP